MKIEKFIFYILLANFTLISAFGILREKGYDAQDLRPKSGKVSNPLRSTAVLSDSVGQTEKKAFNDLINVRYTASPVATLGQKEKRKIDLTTLAKSMVNSAKERALTLLGSDFAPTSLEIDKQLRLRFLTTSMPDDTLTNAINYGSFSFDIEVDKNNLKYYKRISELAKEKIALTAAQEKQIREQFLEDELRILNNNYSQVVQSLRKVSKDSVIFPDKLTLDTLKNFKVFVKKN